MKQTVVGVFDRYESARHAANLLQDSGFGPEAVHLTDGTGEDGGTAPAEHRGAWDSIRSFFAEVFGSERDSQEHMDAYAEALRRGCAVVKVDVDDEPRVDRARQLLESAGAVNIDERVAQWREQGWSGEVDAAAFDRLRDDGALGTRAVAGGDSGPSDAGSVGMPASEQIGAMRSAAHADDVDRLARDAGRLLTRARDADADVRDWRDDWQRQYAALGGRYEDYDPAYRWGHTLRGDARWQGREWDDIEPELRGEWERGHPGSAWDRFKAAVRHGWERVTG